MKTFSQYLTGIYHCKFAENSKGKFRPWLLGAPRPNQPIIKNPSCLSPLSSLLAYQELNSKALSGFVWM